MKVATPPTADSLLLFKLLGESRDAWHSYIEIRDAIAKTVPPGRALRRYERDRMNNFDRDRRPRHHNDPVPPPKRSEDEQIFFGQRSCAQTVISSWKRQGALLVRGKDNGREIKVRPGWTSWGIPGFEPERGQLDNEGESEASETPGVSSPTPKQISAPQEALAPSQSAYDEALVQIDESLAKEPAEEDVTVEPETVRNFRPAEDEWKPAERFERTPDLANAVSREGGVLASAGLPESCELCGLVMGNAARHMQWHEEQIRAEQAPEMALLNESQLKDLLSKVLVDVLDTFQNGMQAHLDARFAQLESMMAAALRTSMRWVSEPPR